MATITPVLWTRKNKSGSSHTIYIRIEAGNRRQYVSTGVTIKQADWNANKGIARKGRKHADKINTIIEELKHELEGIVLDLRLKKVELTPQAIKEGQKSKCLGNFDLIKYGHEYADQLLRQNKISTGRRYFSIFRKLAEYTTGPLPAHKLSPTFIRAYETYLIEVLGNGPGTVSTNMRAIRAVFNRGVNDGLISDDLKPFKGITFKEPRTEKMWLSTEELEQLGGLDLEPESAQWHVRNYFLFATYCAGIRFTDVCELKVRNVAKAEFNYRTSKTKTPIQFSLPKPAKSIIDLYTGQSISSESRLFPILRTYDTSSAVNLRRAISSQNAYTNKILKQLAKKAQIDKSISFHMARHTFSNYALRSGWGVRQIQQVLGHKDIKTTEAYLADFDPSFLGTKIDELFKYKN